ncbi:aldehyde dehydrogenase family protein, partial [Rhizobium sp. SIMBA_035]
CTELPFAEIATGDTRDVDRAVAAAKRAFESFSQTTPDERVALVRRILEMYLARYDEIAAAISREIGAPRALAYEWQAGIGRRHLEELL